MLIVVNFVKGLGLFDFFKLIDFSDEKLVVKRFVSF